MTITRKPIHAEIATATVRVTRLSTPTATRNVYVTNTRNNGACHAFWTGKELRNATVLNEPERTAITRTIMQSRKPF